METQTQNTSTFDFKKWGIIGLILLVSLILVGTIVSTSNEEVETRSTFVQKMDERKAFYDKLYKIIAQKSQVALKNDTSFRANINIIMSGRKDAEGVMMKWIQESNPNADYKYVAELYKDLSRTIEAERNGFFEQEKVLQDIVRLHSNLLNRFPSGLVLKTFMGRKPLEYKPISSSRTDEVFKTGKDDNVDMGL